MIIDYLQHIDYNNVYLTFYKTILVLHLETSTNNKTKE